MRDVLKYVVVPIVGAAVIVWVVGHAIYATIKTFAR
jgi:hypothetical protein